MKGRINGLIFKEVVDEECFTGSLVYCSKLKEGKKCLRKN